MHYGTRNINWIMTTQISSLVSEIIIQHENRLRMESEDQISALIRRICDLEDRLDQSNHQLIQKKYQLDSVIAKYSSMRSKVLANITREEDRENSDQHIKKKIKSNITDAIATSKSNSRRSHPTGRKCTEVIRSKSVRASLPGFECLECKNFYDAMIEQGIFKPGDKMEMLQVCSRHKAKWLQFLFDTRKMKS